MSSFRTAARGNPYFRGFLQIRGDSNALTLDMSNDENVKAVISYSDKLCSSVNSSDKEVIVHNLHHSRVFFSDFSCKD